MGALNLKNKIFGFFGNYYKLKDSNKDGNDKGTIERFNESIAEDFDEVLDPLIFDLVKNVLDPLNCLEKYLEFIEGEHGNDQLFITSNLADRRVIQKYINRIYNIKGTIEGYNYLLRFIGFTATFEEIYHDYSFDSSVTLDDTVRTFDMNCEKCTNYCIDLSRTTGSGQPTEDELKKINIIIEFNQPINTTLDCIKYEGGVITPSGDFNNDYSDDYYIEGS